MLDLQKERKKKKNNPSRKKLLKETQRTEVFALANKDFKGVIINMYKKIKRKHS